MKVGSNFIGIKKSFSWVIVFAMLIQVFAGVTPVFADQGGTPKMPSIGDDVVNSGTGTWSNATNGITTDDPMTIESTSAYAAIENIQVSGPIWNLVYGPNKSTHYIVGSNYGFDIPDNSVIEEIRVNIDRRDSVGKPLNRGTSDLSVNLVKGGSIVGTNKASSSIWPIFSSVATYGTGDASLWGQSWTAEEINSPGFGVALSAQSNALAPRIAYVDYMSIDVYYSSAPVIDAHNDIVVGAEYSVGNNVEYTPPNSIDDVDGVLPSTCSLPSGSLFPIGTTPVKCDKTDAAGNVAISTYFNVIVQDTKAPAVPEITSPDNNSKANPSGLYFNWTNSTDISGPVTYEYQSNFNVSATGPAATAANGLSNNYLLVSGSSDNVYTWQVRACDSAIIKNCSVWSDTRTVILDSTAPVNLGKPKAYDNSSNKITSPTNDGNVNWIWTAPNSKIAGLDHYQWKIFKDGVIFDKDVTNSLTVSRTLTEEGTYRFEVRAWDKAGNVTLYSISDDLVYDVTAPTVPVLKKPVDQSYTQNRTPKFNWNHINHAYRYQLQICGMDSGDSGLNNTCTDEILRENGITDDQYILTDVQSLADGEYWGRVRARDEAGNFSAWSASNKFTVDNEAPVVTITALDDGEITNDSTPSFTVTSSDPSTTDCSVNGDINGSMIKDNEGVWSYTVESSLEDGVYQYNVKCIDAAGNKGKSNRTFTVDTINPTGLVTYSTIAPTNGAVIAVLTVDDINGPVEVTDNFGLKTYIFINNGTFTFEFKDAAGNTGSAIATVTNIDRSVPVITLNDSASMSLTVGGTFTDPGAVTNDGSAVVVTGSVDTAVVGVYTLSYNSTDAVGNAATTVNRTVTVNAAPLLLTGEVLGDTDTTTPPLVEEKGEVKGTSDTKKDDTSNWYDASYLGVPWYGWLGGAAVAGGAGWWLFGAFRRRQDEE